MYLYVSNMTRNDNKNFLPGYSTEQEDNKKSPKINGNSPVK
jgi:hypothetical protein